MRFAGGRGRGEGDDKPSTRTQQQADILHASRHSVHIHKYFLRCLFFYYKIYFYLCFYSPVPPLPPCPGLATAGAGLVDVDIGAEPALPFGFVDFRGI